jgi:Flp pilus assembly pilin Flp
LFSVLRREEGQGLAEYALILSLIVIVAVAGLLLIGGNITGLISGIGSVI